jgi:hypothetical protein
MRLPKNIVDEARKNIPEYVLDAILSINTSNLVYNIGQKNNLHIDQQGNLGEEVGYLMLGLTKREDFVKVLAKELSIDETKATAIARDVNNEILEKIRENMRAGIATEDAKKESETNKIAVKVAPDTMKREDLLKEIETPTATPISGRKFVSKADEGIRNPESGIRTDVESGIRDDKGSGIPPSPLQASDGQSRNQESEMKIATTTTPSTTVPTGSVVFPSGGIRNQESGISTDVESGIRNLESETKTKDEKVTEKAVTPPTADPTANLKDTPPKYAGDPYREMPL